jgi:hypothetical protein
MHSNLTMLFILAKCDIDLFFMLYLKHKKQIDITCLNFGEIENDLRGNISDITDRNSFIVLGEIKPKLSKESLIKSAAQLDLRIVVLKNIIEWIKDGLDFEPGVFGKGIIFSLDTPENQKFKIVDNNYSYNLVLL